ncbi:Uncharacterised protein [Salmonella enterica subsp. enterica]|uniref:Uncharacterized protein n=1 Tax=Salmonella enterica I TaxID=59201 RepID=A0A379WAB6_SALET|nr:Uncharacterised protein [Salmonella enterica subsp. enterica]
MTDTAYSKSLEKEVDPEQYLVLTGHTIDTIHTFAREDIVCPICEATGGTFVRGGTNARFNRRAHFRFRNTKTKAITILLAISTMSASHLMSKTIWFTSLPTEQDYACYKKNGMRRDTGGFF